MDEIVMPFEWHSFCISIHIGLNEATVAHNGKIQAIQIFGDLTDDTQDEYKFMTHGHLGGTKFIGTLTHFEIFGRPLSNETILKWTMCQNKVNSFCVQFFKQKIF